MTRAVAIAARALQERSSRLLGSVLRVEERWPVALTPSAVVPSSRGQPAPHNRERVRSPSLWGMLATVLPELDIEKLRRSCRRRVPDTVADEVRLEVSVEGARLDSRMSATLARL